MYLLDTNVVSLLDARRRSFSQPLVEWIKRNGSALYLSAMSIAELEAGGLKLRRRKHDARAAEIMALLALIEAHFGERILPMDRQVARALAQIEDQIFPRTIELADLIIAATAKVHGYTILTANIRHFAITGVPSINPVADLQPELV
jgi:predicted nucleic acid-binding protein